MLWCYPTSNLHHVSVYLNSKNTAQIKIPKYTLKLIDNEIAPIRYMFESGKGKKVQKIIFLYLIWLQNIYIYIYKIIYN